MIIIVSVFLKIFKIKKKNQNIYIYIFIYEYIRIYSLYYITIKIYV